MTLIIGIKCSDGLVLGADGAATLGDVTGLITVLQPVAKLKIVKEKAIVAVSGPVGLSQLYVDSIDKLCNSFRDCDGPTLCRKIRDEFRKDAEIALHMAALARQVIGNPAQIGAVTQTLVALAAKDGKQLIQFDCECNPEMATEDLFFTSIGSGQPIADPFLAFIRRVFWDKGLPSLADGIFAVVWTLHHAINTAPGGIAEPIELAILKIDGTQAEAKKLTDGELKEHRQHIDEAERYIKKFKEQERPTATEPQPPNPPR